MAHLLDAARDHDLARAGHDFVGGEVDRLQARSALAVDRGACDLDREPRQQRDHAADIQPLLARLVGASPDHVLDFGRVEFAIALEQAAHAHHCEVVGADVLVIAVLVGAADWRANSVNDYHFVHDLRLRG